MKIAINLRGVSKGKSGLFTRDWKLSKNSIKEKIINCWEGHEIKLYITTYMNDEIESLLNFYEPYKYQIIENKGQISTFVKSFDIIDSDEDFIITTRFDINFVDKISNFKINYNKINFLFKEGTDIELGNPFVTDNIFLFPSKYKEIFLSSILESTNENSSHMHDIYIKLMTKINENNFHFIIEDNPLNFSHENLIYELVRAKNID